MLGYLLSSVHRDDDATVLELHLAFIWLWPKFAASLFCNIEGILWSYQRAHATVCFSFLPSYCATRRLLLTNLVLALMRPGRDLGHYCSFLYILQCLILSPSSVMDTGSPLVACSFGKT